MSHPMSVAVVTGSAGLIGAESCRLFAEQGFDIVGIDNDMRSYFFGAAASTQPARINLEHAIAAYRHVNADIRDEAALSDVFARHGKNISVVIHSAAQPSHDWAAREPLTDFAVNATGTLLLLEATRRHCPQAVFIFTSTNKVYGDTPNLLPLIEQETRWEIESGHPFAEFGIDESMSIDRSTHSLFGVSKIAADLLVQEYGRYFGMKTVCFRGGCLTGPDHSGAQLHGFLSYLMKCAISGAPYTVLGYKGKQVRDNIHARDLVEMFWHFFQNPRPGEVYNAGGARRCNCSMREAIALCEQIARRKLNWTYQNDNRVGDHIWWISDVRKFESHYPGWTPRYGLSDILTEIHDRLASRQAGAAG
jgi:CDP-paratose 2-epimerase